MKTENKMRELKAKADATLKAQDVALSAYRAAQKAAQNTWDAYIIATKTNDKANMAIFYHNAYLTGEIK